MTRFAFALALLVLPGCVQKPEPARINATLYNEVAQRAAAQVRRCYRTPRVASSGKQISTRLLVRFREDGGLAALPKVVSQAGVTPDNSAYAPKMAEAAGLAVMRCAPLRLPPDLYQGWGLIELTFSPAARA